MQSQPPREQLVTDDLKAQSELFQERRRALTTVGPVTLSSNELDEVRARLRQRQVPGEWRTA